MNKSLDASAEPSRIPNGTIKNTLSTLDEVNVGINKMSRRIAASETSANSGIDYARANYAIDFVFQRVTLRYPDATKAMVRLTEIVFLQYQR